MLVSAIDYGLSPAEAVTTTRYGTQHFVGSFLQTPPVLGSLSIDDNADPKLVEALKALGHKVELVKAPQWNPNMLSIDPESKLIRAAGDPRAKRHAAAF
jgi:gamma-glutamyltranspeptidase